MKRNLLYLVSILGVTLVTVMVLGQGTSVSQQGAGSALSKVPESGSDPYKPSLERTFTESTLLLTVSELLESNRIQDAKALIGVHLNGNILEIDELLPLSDTNAARLGTNFLRRMAGFRKNHPTDYNSSLFTNSLSPNDIAIINAKVNSVLSKYDK
jgi:hypothetical protein